jgi:hypothetical protein
MGGQLSPCWKLYQVPPLGESAADCGDTVSIACITVRKLPSGLAAAVCCAWLKLKNEVMAPATTSVLLIDFIIADSWVHLGPNLTLISEMVQSQAWISKTILELFLNYF